MSNALQTLTTSLAQRLNMGDGAGLIQTLKATAFKGEVSDAQMTALMVVANQYGLNPWTKEIYAFPDRNNGIVPVVGVDGWSRIINSHEKFDGMEFEQDQESCTCVIFRKDRTHPIKVTEWMSECKREGVGPWKSHPKRMLRHKAMIQCARLAFGYGGIYDQDEAERIVESDVGAPAAEAARGPQRRSSAQPLEVVERVDVTPEEVKPSKAPIVSEGAGSISVGQAAYLRNKLKAAGIEEASVCARYQVTGIEMLTVDAFDTVKAELLSMA